MYFVGQVLYYQLNLDYIIETYCVNKEKPELQCNGKCHLAKQLQVTQTKIYNNEESAINVIVDAFYPLYLQTYKLESHLMMLVTFPQKKWFLNTSKTTPFIDELFHPPRLMS
nr:hypothetical protein [uncultured Psychroserpens sp.]